MRNEPSRVVARATAAATATWGVIVIAADVDSVLAGAVTVALSAWIAFAGEIVRARVQPVDK